MTKNTKILSSGKSKFAGIALSSLLVFFTYGAMFGESILKDIISEPNKIFEMIDTIDHSEFNKKVLDSYKNKTNGYFYLDKKYNIYVSVLDSSSERRWFNKQDPYALLRLGTDSKSNYNYPLGEMNKRNNEKHDNLSFINLNKKEINEHVSEIKTKYPEVLEIPNIDEIFSLNVISHEVAHSIHGFNASIIEKMVEDKYVLENFSESFNRDTIKEGFADIYSFIQIVNVFNLNKEQGLKILDIMLKERIDFYKKEYYALPSIEHVHFNSLKNFKNLYEKDPTIIQNITSEELFKIVYISENLKNDNILNIPNAKVLMVDMLLSSFVSKSISEDKFINESENVSDSKKDLIKSYTEGRLEYKENLEIISNFILNKDLDYAIKKIESSNFPEYIDKASFIKRIENLTEDEILQFAIKNKSDKDGDLPKMYIDILKENILANIDSVKQYDNGFKERLSEIYSNIISAELNLLTAEEEFLINNYSSNNLNNEFNKIISKKKKVIAG